MDINTALDNLGDIDETEFEKVAGPIGLQILEILNLDEDEDISDGQLEAMEAEFERLSNELAESEEVKPYRLCEDGIDYKTIFAASIEKAMEYASANIGSYNLSGGTIWIYLMVKGLLTDEEDADSVELSPPEPECSEGEHSWHAPYSVVGGIKENPGVWGHGGGVIIREACKHCGAYRITDTWAQDETTGRQGLTSTAYQAADENSLAWVLRTRLTGRFATILTKQKDAYDQACKEVLEIDASSTFDGIVPKELNRPGGTLLRHVESIIDDIETAFERIKDQTESDV
jgi:hypothetical protein